MAAFIEGNLSAIQVIALEAHAARCTRCRELLSLARADSSLDALSRSRAVIGAVPPRSGDATPAGDEAGDEPLDNGTTIGRYTILERIGAGGMGLVYAAYDPELDRKVAVKVLRGDALRASAQTKVQERLLREARAMAQLAHPNVVAVYDLGRFRDRVFVAMELVEGDTLARWFSARRRSWREVVAAFLAAGEGLVAVHAAGLVHRDFKPENVFVGRDGRVRVGDFGLVQDEVRSPANAENAASPSGPLTSSGAFLGTPGYMAPEQLRGDPADARADQFSFCVALYRALYRDHPFGGATLGELADAVTAGHVRPPPVSGQTPRWLARVVLRGLSAAPDDRYASMAALLQALARDPARQVRRGAAIALVAAVIAVSSWWIARSRAAYPDERCTGAAAAFATTWNPERRAAMTTAFAATHMPYADAALRRVTGELDHYAAQWIEAYTDACRATHLRGEQSEAMLDLRMTCLERRRQQVTALVGALAAADAAVVARSVTAQEALVDVSGCADLAALQQVVPPPSDPAARTRLAELTQRLAEADARHETGAYTRAYELVVPVVADARALGHRPFEAEAEYLQATIELALGEFARAETTYNTAIWAAEAGRLDELAARAWTSLVFVVGYRRSEFARGEALVPRATSAIARLGSHPDIEARLEYVLDAIDSLQHKLGSAAAHAERAVALEERVHGSEHLHVASALESLGTTRMQQGDVERGMQTLQRALDLRERLLGPDHPTLAHVLTNLGHAHIDQSNYPAGEQAMRRALAICEATLAPDHPDLARAVEGLGRALRLQRRTAEALVFDRRAVEIAEKRYGPDDLHVESPLFGLGLALGRLGHYAEADVQLRRAEAIATKVLGPRHVRVMVATAARGDVLMMQSRWREAATLYESVLPVLEGQPGTQNDVADFTCKLGRAYVELHRPARALDRLERLARTLDKLPPDLRVAVELALARALWDSGGDRKRAHELATRANQEIRGVADAAREDIVEIERWLASHRVP